jgi:transcriptional regulator with XRE-family HTH domain
MPDIGATLREARMRARIDISEIESETKIRAKYLRALENEEWDLLPGPTYVKSFLRTYADALGLDGKLLIEEYKLRHERLSDVELQPIAPPGRRERQRQRRGVPRGAVIAVIVAGLLVSLYFLNKNSQDQSTGPLGSTTTSQRSKASTKPKKHHKRRRTKLTVVATGQVYVCLKGRKRTLVPGLVLTNGGHKGPYRAAKFRLRLGNSEARLVVNGKSHSVPAVAAGVGYEIAAGKIHRLQPADWPNCPAA